MPDRRLLISFSGGETSAYMTWWVFQNWRDRYDSVRVVFANTGEENEETLEFVRDVSMNFNIPVTWIESVIHHGERKAPTHRVVSFDTASRRGEPFEAHIQKHGIPNYKFKDCTRNLKRRPIESYARSIGWPNGSYDLAIGIRTDETDRVSAESAKRRIVYPLAFEHPMTKAKVNAWWEGQNFRLRLKAYQGNCRWCWKKSRRKLLTLVKETPQVFDFPRRMEKQYAEVGPEFAKERIEGYRRTFFRGNVSVEGLFAEAAALPVTFVPASDEAQVFDFDIDASNGCEDSCEVWGLDDPE